MTGVRALNGEPGFASAEGDDLAFLSAVEVLRLFRRRELAPSEYLSHLFRRIQADQDHPRPLNAFTELLEVEAREQARAADESYSLASGDSAPSPLAGLPVATKEKHGLKGRTLSQGMRAFRDAVATENHPVVERLQDSGAIIHARTTSPEFSCATVTHSSLWGVTRNPWNRELSPGGSSGGAAAALAGGLTPLATASDIAGSTRLPAGFCGLVGYKGPYGTVPGMGPLAADWYRGDGAMARTVGDTLLLTHVLRGKHPLDHGSIPAVDALPTSQNQTAQVERAQDGLGGMRIAYSPTLGNYPVERGVQETVEAAVHRLAEAGAEVVEVDLPWSTEEISQTTMAHFGHLLAGGITQTLAGHEDTMESYTRRFVEVANEHASKLSLFQSLEREHRMQAELASAMKDFSVLVTPVSAVRALDAEGEYLNGITVGNQVDGAERVLEHYWEAHMTVPFNVANRCPVLAVPAGLDRGYPVGMQIVGHPFDEHTVFQVGAAWELIAPALRSTKNR